MSNRISDLSPPDFVAPDNYRHAAGENPETLNNSMHTPGTLAISQRRFRIAGDVIAKAVKDLPDDQRIAIKWAAGYCRERNISCEEFGGLLTQPGRTESYSGDSVYAALTGRRDAGSMERFAKAVDVLRRRIEETAPRRDSAFVETALTRQIFKHCRAAFTKKRLTFIYGESQIGKTTGVEEYARLNNHGETILIRMPSRGTYGGLLEELALRLHISPQVRMRHLERRILEAFDDRTLLIVDECHQCFSNGANRALDALEFLREIHDRRKCGMVLIGTNVFRDHLRTNRVLRQLWLRGYRPLQLPAHPSARALADFSRSYGLSPAEDKDMTIEITRDLDGESIKQRVKANPNKLESSVVKDHGLGRWLSILDDASDMAAEKGAKISWGRVIAAFTAFQDESSEAA